MKKEKPLFTCESDIEANDYKKLAKYYPNKFYWNFVRTYTIINVILFFVFSLIDMNFESGTKKFIVFQVLIMLFCRLNLEGMAAKAFKNSADKNELDTHFDTDFFEDYFVRKGATMSLTIKYSEITKCIENDNNFYLDWSQKNTVIILQKSKCSLELINFIRKTFEVDNRLGDNKKIKTPKKRKNNLLKGLKISERLMITLLILTILCGIITFLLSAYEARLDPPDLYRFMEKLWILFLLSFIPLLSIIGGFVTYKINRKIAVSNIVIGFMVMPYMTLIGLLAAIPGYEVDYSEITPYKEYIPTTLPDEAYTQLFELTSGEKIYSIYLEENNIFSGIKDNDLWIKGENLKTDLMLYLEHSAYKNDDLYYCFYNRTTDEYNTLPSESGTYTIYVMKFAKSSNKLELSITDFEYLK